MTEPFSTWPGAWEPPRKPPHDALVYHYTTTAGLKGIIESGTLWATEATGLNDVEEITYGRRVITEWLENQPPTPGIQRLMELAAHEFSSGDPTSHNGPADTFILSASIDGDDANQWRNYALGNGHAIGITTKPRLSIATSSPPGPIQNSAGDLDFRELFNSAHSTGWRLVNYSEQQVDGMLQSLKHWVQMATSWEEVAPAGDPEDGDPHPSEVVDHLIAEALNAASTLIKAEGFRGEREARVVASVDWASKHGLYRASPYGLVRSVMLTTSGESDVRGFCVLPQVEWTLPLRSVTMSPSPYAERGLATMQAFLAHHGYERAHVLTSEVPVRIA